MNSSSVPIKRLSDYTWLTLELAARSVVQIDEQVKHDYCDAIANYRNTGFCSFNPYGEDEEALHHNIADAIAGCTETQMHSSSKAGNYRSSDLLCDADFLQEYNQYIRFSQLDVNALNAVSDFLTFHNELLIAMLGYRYNVLNVRCQISEPGATVPPFDWHKDELPTSIVKVLYYLDGASTLAGTTAIKLEDGEDIYIEGDIGSWVLININEVFHKGVPSVGRRRKMLEITLGPAIVGDCTAYVAALNASYPWVPWLSPSFGHLSSGLSVLADYSTSHFNSLVAELDNKEATNTNSHSLTNALSVLQYNAENQPKNLNIGGGPSFLHRDWRNFEAIFSIHNPVPFTLSPDVDFPIKAGSLETVYSSHNLEHLDDETVSHVLTQAYKVLKQGGGLVIKIPDFDLYLDSWRKSDTSLTFENSPFSFKEARTWRNKAIPDTITYRTAEMFCGVWNLTFGDEKALFSNTGDWQGPGYVGAPWIAEKDINEVFTDYQSCHDIAAYLKNRALTLDEKVFLNHQNAWSRDEMRKILSEIGFEIVSVDSSVVCEMAAYIPGIEQWKGASAYYLAKKL